MNANELADLLADSNDPDIRRAVAMLRQQQAEIEGAEPLYTGFKELTDEEIKETIKPIIFNQYMTAYKYGFEVAKAILRKAQEK